MNIKEAIEESLKKTPLIEAEVLESQLESARFKDAKAEETIFLLQHQAKKERMARHRNIKGRVY